MALQKEKMFFVGDLQAGALHAHMNIERVTRSMGTKQRPTTLRHHELLEELL